MYKKLVLLDEKNRVISTTTSAFESGSEWVEVGEQDSRHWHAPILQGDGIHAYKLVDGEMVERTDEEILHDTEINNALNELSQLDSKMARENEDIISSMTETQFNKLPKYRQDLYNEKQAKREAYLLLIKA